MKYKKIILIHPYPYYQKGVTKGTISPPLGLGYIASVLENMGCEVKIIDANIIKMKNQRVLAEIKKFNPDLIGITINVISFRVGIELYQLICKKTEYPILFGGPYATSNHIEIYKKIKPLCIIRGEAELTIQEICKGKKLSEIDGITYMDDVSIKVNKDRDLIENLDELPQPAYNLFPDLKLYSSRARSKPIGFIVTSRGCPNLCTYCNSNIFGKRFRARSPENVLEEIDMLVKKFGVRQIDIIDDNFTLNINRAGKIFDMIVEREYNIYINFQNGLAVNSLTRELVKKMKKAGVYKVSVGVESASPRILNSVKKNIDLKQIEKVFKWFKEEKIITQALFILGFPEDTEESMQETIDFAIKLKPSLANFSRLIPFPGTEMYCKLKESGLLLNGGFSDGFLGTKAYFKNPNLSNEKTIEYQKKAYLKFNFRPKQIIRMIKDIRSWSEFKWTMTLGLQVVKGIFLK